MMFTLTFFLLNVYFTAVFGISGLAKLHTLPSFAATLRHQRILPAWIIPTFSRIFPWLELVVATCLVTGFMPIFTSLIVFALCITFLVIKVLLARTNPTASCGCSGAMGYHKVDAASLVVSVVLIVLSTLQLAAAMWGAKVDVAWRLATAFVYCATTGWLLYCMLMRRYRLAL